MKNKNLVRKHLFIFIALVLLLFSCKAQNLQVKKSSKTIEFSKKAVNKLIQLPLHCVETEYPNKLSQTIGDTSYLKTPKELHPTFYGCFDWHSSVHGLSTGNPKLKHLKNIASHHIQYSYPNLVGDSYEGGHWLASFAIYALDSQ